jgi:cardiolipin synthase
LVIAFNSGDGREATASIIYAVIGGTDYLDGMTARVTGQYSRLGVLLDPIVDRMLVLSGVAVAWHYELLPRWALALLAARELFMLVLARYALHRGVDLKINWLGRWGVWPVFGALFFAMCAVHWLALACLYVGLVLVLGATVLYVRDGLQRAREQGST